MAPQAGTAAQTVCERLVHVLIAPNKASPTSSQRIVFKWLNHITTARNSMRGEINPGGN